MRLDSTKIGILSIVLCTLFFSSMETALKGIAGQFNPVQMTLTRFLIGGIALIPFARQMLRKKKVKLDWRAYRDFAFLGFLGVLISMTLYQLAVEYANASVVAVLFSCNPVFVVIFAFLLLRIPIKKNQVASLIFQIAGIVFLINPFHIDIHPIGLISVLLSIVFFGLYAVLGLRPCEQYSGIVVTCWSFLFGCAEMLVLVALSHVQPIAEFFLNSGLALFANIPLFTGYTLDNLLSIIYICLGVTGGGYAFYFMAMECTSPMMASMVFFFKPVLAPILAAVILHENIPFNMIVGIVLILCGSLFTLLPSLRKKA